MTAPDALASATPVALAERAPVPVPAWRRALTFGMGFGIVMSDGNLEAVILRSRPSGSVLAASTVIKNFAARPAAEWGGELMQFLASAGEPHLAATVVLPREEVIVRSVRLPGVADKDTAAAIELQLDTLHPWDEETIEWSWWRVSADEIVVGIVRQTTLWHYETLFSEAGVPMAAATFSSAVIYAALRLHHTASASIFCFLPGGEGRVEIYGESLARPCYSAGFSFAQERAVALARAELRLASDYPVVELREALSSPTGISPLAYAAAAAASAPLVLRFANLLPADRRASHARTRYLLPATLAALVALGLLAVFVLFPFLNERSYVKDLLAEQNRLEVPALRVRSIDTTLAEHRKRIAALDDFRRRPQADLDVLNELVRLLPEQVWTSSIEIYPDSIVIAGEADQAAPLLKLLDSSPLFQNSEPVMAVTRTAQQTEQFRIKSMRRGRAGRTTP